MIAEERIAWGKEARWSSRRKRGLGVGMDNEKQEHREGVLLLNGEGNLNRRAGAGPCPYEDTPHV